MENETVKGIASLLESKKLKNVEAFDLKFKSELVKYIILATSPNEKYSRQVAVELQKEFEEKGIDAQKTTIGLSVYTAAYCIGGHADLYHPVVWQRFTRRSKPNHTTLCIGALRTHRNGIPSCAVGKF